MAYRWMFVTALLVIPACVQCDDTSCQQEGLTIHLERQDGSSLQQGEYEFAVDVEGVPWSAVCELEHCRLERDDGEDDPTWVVALAVLGGTGDKSYALTIVNRIDVQNGTDLLGPEDVQASAKLDGALVGSASYTPTYERSETSEPRECGICESANETLIIGP